MNREKVFGLVSEAIVTREKQILEQDGPVPPGTTGFGVRMSPYDRSAFLYDLAHQLAEAENEGKPKPATDEGWAEVVVQSYLARTAVATAGARK